MTPERWERIGVLYHSALKLFPEQRSAYLREACRNDEELRREIEGLLEQDDSFLERPAWEAAGSPGSEASVTIGAATFARWRRLFGMAPPEPTLSRAIAGAVTRPATPPLGRWGAFDLLERVGSGGFGEVYLAFDPALRREIAVKLLLPPKEASGISSDMQDSALLREARAMARVTHPNLVPIYGVGTFDGRAGFWSAFVRGKTLSALLAMTGPFGPQETILIGIDLCRAVSAVHAAGLLHRDLKPANVMREEGGRILLMDFGLSESQARQTIAGGTPGYMAPEILSGGKATVRTDVYALGVLLYHLLTDKFPQGEHWSLLDQRPDLPVALVTLVHRAIEPDPSQRFASAAEMAAALAEAGGSSVGTQIPVVIGKSRKTYAWITGMAVLLAAIGIAFERQSRTTSTAPLGVQQQYDKAHDLLLHYYRPHALETIIPDLETISRQAPNFAAGFSDLGRANLRQFMQMHEVKYEEPGRVASLKAIALDPNLASAHVTLGMLYTQTDRNDLAAQELDTALRLDRLDAEVWAARAELYMRQGRTEDVEPAIRKAMDLAPSDWRWPFALADFENRLGKTDESIAATEAAIRLSPDNARAYNNLGHYLRLKGRLKEAEAALRKSISLEPGYNRYTNLGAIEDGLGNTGEAERMYRQAIALNPSDYLAWDYLAQLYDQQKSDPAKIQSTWRKAIELGEALRTTRPRDVNLLTDLGRAYASIGDSEHATPLLREVMTLVPENNIDLYQCGVAFELLHQRANAVDAVTAALRKGYPLDRVNRDALLADLRKDSKYLAIIQSMR